MRVIIFIVLLIPIFLISKKLCIALLIVLYGIWAYKQWQKAKHIQSAIDERDKLHAEIAKENILKESAKKTPSKNTSAQSVKKITKYTGGNK